MKEVIIRSFAMSFSVRYIPLLAASLLAMDLSAYSNERLPVIQDCVDVKLFSSPSVTYGHPNDTRITAQVTNSCGVDVKIRVNAGNAYKGARSDQTSYNGKIDKFSCNKLEDECETVDVVVIKSLGRNNRQEGKASRLARIFLPQAKATGQTVEQMFNSNVNRCASIPAISTCSYKLDQDCRAMDRIYQAKCLAASNNDVEKTLRLEIEYHKFERLASKRYFAKNPIREEREVTVSRPVKSSVIRSSSSNNQCDRGQIWSNRLTGRYRCECPPGMTIEPGESCS